MKMKSLFFLLFLSVLFSSCSDDDNDTGPQISQEQLEAVTGMYNLTEYIVNPPQDPNNDGTFSEDLMTELNCLSGSIILREDLSYNKFYIDLNITFITNGLFAIFCGDNISESGTWDLVNGLIVLSEEPERSYVLNGSVLTLSDGNDLPDSQTQVFVKQ